ncbi:MAG: DUF6519 domain-containing protein [Myxococcota bacterium]
MKGDFSRGFNPDRKRDARYRRVLLQQGRVLLDSDHAALVDATDQQLRTLSRGLGCPAGSPDYGFLITPGRLLRLFERITDLRAGPQIDAALAPVTAWLDYSRKYLDRYPSLYIEADSGEAVVDIPLHATCQENTFTVWTQANTGFTLTAQAIDEDGAILRNNANALMEDDVQVTASAGWRRRLLDMSAHDGFSRIRLRIPAGSAFWIGLIEGHAPFTNPPRLWAAAGTFHADGLVTHLDSPAGYPNVSFPEIAGFSETDPGDPLPALPRDERFVAFLEVYERHLTHIHDRGIREEALGGQVDTTTRTAVVGQVKILHSDTIDLTDAAYPLAVTDAFAAISKSSGTLLITPAPDQEVQDPCDLPLDGGYTGRDNRLYRVEVHVGGGLGTAQLKWSRDNGAELFAVSSATSTTLTFPAGTDLQAGDYVEVLSEVVEVGDAQPAAVDGDGRLIPPARKVGVLARLSTAASTDGTFTLDDPANPGATLTLDTDRYGGAGTTDRPGATHVRRWSGWFQTVAPGTGTLMEKALENGLTATLEGSYRVGDWWQYEARIRANNDNGPWQKTPHGPERLFAPLALMSVPAAFTQPVTLLAWLDHRFSPICQLDADDISFDGGRIGEDADTVQEIIERIYERSVGGCCEITVEPSGDDDDNVRIAQQITEALPSGGVVCLRRGVYRFSGPLDIGSLNLTIRGCPEAVIVDVGASTLFTVDGGELTLSDLTLLSPAEQDAQSLIDLRGVEPALRAERVGMVMVRAAGAAEPAVAVRAHDAVPAIPAPADAPSDVIALGETWPQPEGPQASIRLVGCLVLCDVGICAQELSTLVLSDCILTATLGAVTAAGVSDLSIEDAVLRTGLQHNALVGLQAEALVADPDDALVGALGPEAGEGVGLHLRRVDAGEIRASALAADTAMWLEAAKNLRISGNTYTGQSIGVRIDQARLVSIIGDQIDAQTLGLEWRITGQQITTSACTIRAGFAIGVGTLDSTIHPLRREFDGVTVADCHLEAAYGGLSIGEPTVALTDGFLSGISVHGNRVLAERGESTPYFGVIAQSVSDGAFTGGASLIDNRIEGFAFGISAQRDGLKISGNRLQLQSPTVAIGLLLWGAQDGVVSDNRIDLTGLDDGATGIGVLDLASSGLRLQQNVMVAQFDIYPVLSASFGDGAGVALVDNQLPNGITLLAGGRGPLIRGNRFDGALLCYGASNGTLSENLFGAMEDNSAIVYGLSGAWQVENNRAAGAIRLLPTTRTHTMAAMVAMAAMPAELTGMVTYAKSGMNATMLSMLATGQPATDTAEVTAAASLSNPTAATMPQHLMHAPVSAARRDVAAEDPIRYSTASIDPQWADRLEETLVVELEENFRPDIGDVVQPEPISYTLENLYQAQVVANWAQTLQIGYRHPLDAPKQIGEDPSTQVAVPNGETIVQVIAAPITSLARLSVTIRSVYRLTSSRSSARLATT